MWLAFATVKLCCTRMAVVLYYILLCCGNRDGLTRSTLHLSAGASLCDGIFRVNGGLLYATWVCLLLLLNTECIGGRDI